MALPVGLQILIVAAMVAVSAWGRTHLDPETRIRARAGTSGIDWTMSKSTALWWTPAIGALVLITTLALDDSQDRAPIAWLGAAVSFFFLAAHWYSVRRAAR